MNIQGYPDEVNYVNAVLHPEAKKCGSFMDYFLHACLHADWENYELLRPVLRKIMEKYPADPERLAMEEHDTGTGKGMVNENPA